VIQKEHTFYYVMFALCHEPSVCLSSVMFVRPTQWVELLGNFLQHLIA